MTLKTLTSKKHIFYVDRGNTAILLSLKLAKHLGRKKVFIQDQGGWMTYQQFAGKAGLELEVIETDLGYVEPEMLNLDGDSVLLINSMPGYYALQENMDKIAKAARDAGALLINDASGSIGTDAAKYGDIILSSFGRWKPINIEYGGFLAFDEDHTAFFEKHFKKQLKDFQKELKKQLKELPERLGFLYGKAEKVKKQLKDFDVLHRDKKGLNVIVGVEGPGQEMEVIDFCKVYDYEWTKCPRYIRVMRDAVSIELKRL